MLEPEVRQLLLESLRPPAGYSLDRAVGTTFSLDLNALLMAPLAFALFDNETDDGRPDPVALLEAVRRHAERIDLFCQAGQIALPAQFERVLAYVEASVHQVAPDKPGYIFHPKIWLLRFAGADGDVRFRLLCLTRNLTFARSWDTILALETNQDTAGGNGKPLADFIRSLPDLAPRALPPGRRQAVLELASEVADAAFLPPAPFDDVAFLPLGIKRHRRTSLPLEGGELRLVVSPFLGHQASEDFGASSTVTLVSRSETFDALPVASLAAFDPYVISSDAVGPVDDDAEVVEATSDTAAERAGCPLRGLHAKLFVAERGWDARVWTGSANASRGAFNGNVEFLVELRGRRSACGLEAMLGDSGVTFKTLLEPYSRAQEEPVEKSAQELLEERLDELRHALARGRFLATVERAGDDETFGLGLAVALDRALEADGRVWPISLSDARAKPLAEAMTAGADFGEVSFDRLTSFFAVELKLTGDESTAMARFVVNAEVEGMPEDRGNRLLGRLLESREKVLRYLLMLLAEDGFAADGSGAITRLIDALDHADAWQDSAAVPLLESLLKVLARDPKRLDHVAGLAESLRATPEGAALLPDGFEEVWEPIWAARTEIA